MPKPKSVDIVGVCPKCGEAVDFILSKKEVKILYQGFKNPKTGQLKMERLILKRNAAVKSGR